MSNVMRLAVAKMSADAIPNGGGLADGIEWIKSLQQPGKLSAEVKAAVEWANAAIEAVRKAADPNPWKTADDEDIAGEILRQIEAKKRRRT